MRVFFLNYEIKKKLILSTYLISNENKNVNFLFCIFPNLLLQLGSRCGLYFHFYNAHACQYFTHLPKDKQRIFVCFDQDVLQPCTIMREVQKAQVANINLPLKALKGTKKQLLWMVIKHGYFY